MFLCGDRVIFDLIHEQSIARLATNGYRESGLMIDAKTIKAVSLTVHAGDRIRLRLCYAKDNTVKSRVIGVPPTVDLDRLIALLPIAPEVRDARNRSLVLASSRGTASSS